MSDQSNTLPYALLIFDWDGTLIDSEAHIIECMQRAAQAAGVEPQTSVAIRNIIGLGLAEAVQQLYPQLPLQRVREVVDEYRAEFLLRNRKASPLFDGVEQTLRALAAQGYELAIATGKSRRGLDQALLESGLGDLFPITRCADETFSKPHPLMLEEILTDYNRSAADALMIGDSEYDLLMANALGMDAIAVNYGVHGCERLMALRPQACLERFSDLLTWLQR